ncbi:FOG: Transposon-encoded proteins with TYA, reverse transcriptase, integrase domains in various combinations [Plasmopara halstedii]|uniref:FOG: Transposon-encoded proteins with TYA, reverse transcriptase, integrase domains in various combinations n=1 Tax=Plasmopara halstedii TaxID=4781 RepID=A0A0P1ATN4_PLAHL|nr:FOG: Transposon-encoded proteins with TYA, reverse transcriptase, integrase domains in various combinations [Plasmopara halstedii]CEG45462.1 FOG: Transposon-encoded proteins with TYA, reverse transcriptase, integrase domains in various combinations [Plasmopara halstedii]|eukprot:XP_024581831.1 FOG: Transposon-encoded proteins with TYA, reverse transcriptase, integrase domains in various combinations [Plasmopara halstedii]
MINVPYRNAVGCLMNLMVGTRQDLAAAVGALSQFAADPCPTNWQALKRVRYINGTRTFGIAFQADGLHELVEFQMRIGLVMSSQKEAHQNPSISASSRSSNALSLLMVSSSNSISSTFMSDGRIFGSGYVFMKSGGTISWRSKKQRTVAFSSTEAEYMALSEAAQEAVWLKMFLGVFGEMKQSDAVKIYEDFQGSIALAKNPESHKRAEHIVYDIILYATKLKTAK